MAANPAGRLTGPAQVSVVIPTRNRRASLFRAIDSVLSQQGVEVEVIVVDDGSTDGTADEVRKLAAVDPRVCLIEQPAAGAAQARNVGVARSRFPLIAFNDSDDVWLAGKLAKQIAFLDSAGLDLVAGLCRFIDPRGVSSVYPQWSAADGFRVTRDQLLRRNCVPTQTVVIRRALFDELGGFNVKLFRYQDWDLALRASFATDIAMFPEVVAEVTGFGARISDDTEAAVAASQIITQTLVAQGCRRADVAPIFTVAGWNCMQGNDFRLAVIAYRLALQHRWSVGVMLRLARCWVRARLRPAG